MTDEQGFKIPTKEELRPFVADAIRHLGYFTLEALEFLTSLTAAGYTNPEAFRKTTPDQVIGLTDGMRRDPLGAIEAITKRAVSEYRRAYDWNRTQHNGDFLPYVRVRFCAWCDPEWAGQDILVQAKDLSGPPLRNCRLLICQGFTSQGTKRMLKDRTITEIKGRL